MKIIITGATGFIGSNLVEYFIGFNYDINIIARDSSDISFLDKFKQKIVVHRYNGKIKSMIDIFDKVIPDIVIHLASKFTAEHCSEDVDNLIESNISLGIHLLEGMRSCGCKKIITTGTNWQNYESSNYNPTNLYSATKEAFENIAKHYTNSYDISMISLRIYDSYGPKDKRAKLMNLFQKYADSEEEIEMSPGNQLLGMVYITDIVAAYSIAMEKLNRLDRKSFEVFYLTPIQFYSLKDIAKCYEKISCKKLNINWGGRKYRDREVMKPYVGERLPRWNPQIDLEEGIRLIIENS